MAITTLVVTMVITTLEITMVMGILEAFPMGNNYTILSVKNYFKHLLIMFKRRPRYLSNINTLMHVFGYFKQNLSNKEKSFFLDQLDDYRHKKKPLSSITNILSSWIVKYDNKYLEKQSYFNSFPNELVSFEES